MRAITDPEEANTIPRVPFPAPSRPPFAGLSGLTGGPFGQGGGSPVFSLKKREKKKFIDTEIGNSSQIPIDRLRQIDLIRLYTPLPEERKELRIPESIVRLNLAEVKHLLLLCGGCVFVRLSHEEMTKILDFSRLIEEKFKAVEDCFQKQLDSSAKKCIMGKEGNDPDTEEKIRDFNNKADDLSNVLESLQDLVRSKIESIDRSVLSRELGPMKFDSDLDGSAAALSKPLWLSTLIDRYHEDMRLLQKETTGDSGGFQPAEAVGSVVGVIPPSPPTSSIFSRKERDQNPPLGSFCAYLSYTVTEGMNRLTEKDASALYELIHASVTFDSRNPPPPEERPSIKEMQKLWSQRFYNFLKKLSELKTALRDEKSLHDIQKYKRLGNGSSEY